MSITKSGYVAILGKPNSGKSTLMNALLGQKLSIITNKPQTTRKKILGILSAEDYQVIFLDTPGLLKPVYLLQEKMMEQVSESINDADVIIIIVDINEDQYAEGMLKDEFMSKFLINNKKPKLLLLNKIDLVSKAKLKSSIKELKSNNNFNKVVPISALLNTSTDEVLTSIVELLPEGPKFYPEDIVADENERFFVSEIIREKIFELFHEEIPYSCEVLIVDYKERENGKDFIQAEIVVEKESQKKIIVGKSGSAIKSLGQTAREAVEEFLQKKVYLDLRVKVRDKWRSNENMLKSFGYSKKKE
jgi:GTPase